MQENVSITPLDKPMLEDTLTGKFITYGEFHRRVRNLAIGFQHKWTLHTGDVVPIVGPSCIDYALIAHAVWLAGSILSLISNSSSASELACALLAWSNRLY